MLYRKRKDRLLSALRNKQWIIPTTNLSKTYNTSIDILKNDNNIVMLAHDTDAKDTTVQALPAIIQYYQKKGYVFKAIDDQSFYAHQSLNN